jgi:hypothetical protein
MEEKPKEPQKPPAETPQKIPTIQVKPGGDQPGTRAFIQKAETKKK